MWKLNPDKMRIFHTITVILISITLISCDSGIFEPEINLPAEVNDLGNFEIINAVPASNQIYLSWTNAVNAVSYDILVNDTLAVSNITETYYSLAGLHFDKEYKISIRAVNKKNLVKIISQKIRTKKEQISEIYQIRFDKYEYAQYYFISCIRTTDKGYVIYGEAAKKDKGYRLIVKTDDDFNIIWKQEILDESGFHFYIFNDHNVEECSNGDILIYAETTIFKLTQTGELLWKINNLNSNVNESVNFATEMSDGNFLAVGTSSANRTTNTDTRFLAFKFSKDGSVIWKKIFGTTYYNYGYLALTNGDGSFMLVGNTETTGVTSNNYSDAKNGLSLEKMSTNGDILKENIFLYNGFASPVKALRTSDGSIYFVCTGSYVNYVYTSESYIVKTKNDGTFLWERRGSADGEYYASPKAAKVLSDNSLLVVSYLDYDNYGIKEFNDDGKLKSTLILKDFPSPVYIDKDEEGRYVFISKEGYIIKINPDGYVN